jgi:hypothetical protein
MIVGTSGQVYTSKPLSFSAVVNAESDEDLPPHGPPVKANIKDIVGYLGARFNE